MKHTKKSPYNLWQNSAFMVQAAWGRCKSVVPMCIALAVARAGQTVAELLIAPGILRTVETAAPLSEVFGPSASLPWRCCSSPPWHDTWTKTRRLDALTSA